MTKEKKPTDSEVPTGIFAKLAAAMDVVNYIQKEEQKVNGQYRPVSWAAVVAAVRPALLKYGLVLVPGVVKTMTQIPTTKDGKPSGYRTDLIREFVLHDVDSDQKIVFESAGSGWDSLDKDIGKAMTFAKKTALMDLLLLESGEGADSKYDFGDLPDQEKVDAAKPAPATSVAELRELCKQAQAPEEVVAKAYGVDKLELIPTVSVPEAKQRLLARIEAINNKKKEA